MLTAIGSRGKDCRPGDLLREPGDLLREPGDLLREPGDLPRWWLDFLSPPCRVMAKPFAKAPGFLTPVAGKRKIVLASLACLLVCALPTGCEKKPSDDTATAPVISVEAAYPQREAIVEHVLADAVLSAAAQAAISPKLSSPVRSFYVQRGSHVKAGQLLATLENRDLAAAALENKGSYTAARAAYDTATQAQVPEEYQRAQLDVAQARANLDLSQSIVTSRKQLFDQGALPGRDLDTAVAGLVQAQAAFDAATKHLASQQSVGRQAALTSAKGQLVSAEGKSLGANAQVAYSEIRSPISGVVTDRPLFAGETASAGAPLLTVMDTSSLLAKVHLAQSLSQRLALGSKAEVRVPGLDTPVEAKVLLISPALDPGSTTVEVWLRLENAGGTLKVGTPVRVQVNGRRAEHALLVPEAAINKESVMVIGTDSVAHRRSITTGLRDGGKVQVLSGLSQHDQIVTAGVFTLDDGARVKIGRFDTASGAVKPAQP